MRALFSLMLLENFPNVVWWPTIPRLSPGEGRGKKEPVHSMSLVALVEASAACHPPPHPTTLSCNFLQFLSFSCYIYAYAYFLATLVR